MAGPDESTGSEPIKVPAPVKEIPTTAPQNQPNIGLEYYDRLDKKTNEWLSQIMDLTGDCKEAMTNLEKVRQELVEREKKATENTLAEIHNLDSDRLKYFRCDSNFGDEPRSLQSQPRCEKYRICSRAVCSEVITCSNCVNAIKFLKSKYL